jgi:hypothetical protein
MNITTATTPDPTVSRTTGQTRSPLSVSASSGQAGYFIRRDAFEAMVAAARSACRRCSSASASSISIDGERSFGSGFDRHWRSAGGGFAGKGRRAASFSSFHLKQKSMTGCNTTSAIDGS